MAKHKSSRSLYDLLSGRRGHEKDKPDAAAGSPPPVIRRPIAVPEKEPPSWVTKALSRSELESAKAKATAPPLASSSRPIGSAAPSPIARPTATAGISRAPLAPGVRVTYLQLAVAAVGVGCACVIAGYVGYHFGYGSGRAAGPVLPTTQKNPTMEEVSKGPVAVGLVAPRPDGPATPTGTRNMRSMTPAGTAAGPVSITTPTSAARKGPTSTVRPAVPPTPTVRPGPTAPTESAAPAEPTYHVRIMTFGSSQPRDVDMLRGYLSQQGIDTELKVSNQSYILYSQEKFADKAKSAGLASKINKALAEFGKLSRQKMPQDAFTELVR